MTTESKQPVPPKPATNPTKAAARSWSVKTLARQLDRYVRDQNISRDSSVADLFNSLKSSIIQQEIGSSLD